jgi:hypothetical protein
VERRSEALEDLRQDLRIGARQLAQRPGFALAVGLTLGIGLGANSAVFGVLDELVFRPLHGVGAPHGLWTREFPLSDSIDSDTHSAEGYEPRPRGAAGDRSAGRLRGVLRYPPAPAPAGRVFEPHEAATVAVLNRASERRYFSGGAVAGRHACGRG